MKTTTNKTAHAAAIAAAVNPSDSMWWTLAPAAAAAANKPAAAPVASKPARKPAVNTWNNEDDRASGCAYLNERVAQFVERHTEAISAAANMYVRHTPKNGDQWHIELVVETSITRGRVHVDCGKSPASISWAKVDERYVKNLDKLVTKERATSPTKPARRAAETKAQLRAQIDAQAAQIAALVAACAAAGIAVPAAATC